MSFIENLNIHGLCLNRGKLHLNGKRAAVLAKYLCRFVRYLPGHWIITGRQCAFIRDEVNSLDNHSDISEMKIVRSKNPKNINFSYLNVNSVRNKFKNISSLILESVDILIVVESKLNSSFPTAQFLISGFHHPFRPNTNRRSGGLLGYVKSGFLLEF